MTYVDRTLLKDLEQWVERKEIIAVWGPRQSGKTALLRKLAAWIREEKGAQRLNDSDTT